MNQTTKDLSRKSLTKKIRFQFLTAINLLFPFSQRISIWSYSESLGVATEKTLVRTEVLTRGTCSWSWKRIYFYLFLEIEQVVQFKSSKQILVMCICRSLHELFGVIHFLLSKRKRDIWSKQQGGEIGHTFTVPSLQSISLTRFQGLIYTVYHGYTPRA